MTRKQWRTIAAEAQRLTKSWNNVAAIQLLRRTGCGIKDAYDAARKLASLPEVKL